jgi:hypothetical protein
LKVAAVKIEKVNWEYKLAKTEVCYESLWTNI